MFPLLTTVSTAHHHASGFDRTRHSNLIVAPRVIELTPNRYNSVMKRDRSREISACGSHWCCASALSGRRTGSAKKGSTRAAIAARAYARVARGTPKLRIVAPRPRSSRDPLASADIAKRPRSLVRFCPQAPARLATLAIGTLARGPAPGRRRISLPHEQPRCHLHLPWVHLKLVGGLRFANPL